MMTRAQAKIAARAVLQPCLGIPNVKDGIPEAEYDIPEAEDDIPTVKDGIPKVEGGDIPSDNDSYLD